MPRASIYNPGKHAVVPFELRNLKIEIISPSENMLSMGDTSNLYVKKYITDDFNPWFEFYGCWEQSSRFGVHLKGQGMLSDPDEDWDGFSLKATALDKWFSIWSEQAVLKFKEQLGDHSVLRFADNNTMSYFFDVDLRGPVFTLLASYLTPVARASYYDAAKNAGFISQKTHRLIMNAMHSKAATQPLECHEKCDMTISRDTLLSERNNLSKSSFIIQQFNQLLQNLENNHTRLKKKYSSQDLSDVIEVSETLISTLKTAHEHLDLDKDNGTSFYFFCSQSIEKAKNSFNQQRSPLLIRFLTVLRQFIAHLINADNKKQHFFASNTTTKSADVLYAFKAGIDDLEKEGTYHSKPRN